MIRNILNDKQQKPQLYLSKRFTYNQVIILLNNKMYVQSSKSKRYQNDSFDFIIPFLINQSVQQPKQPPPPPKRFSIPNYLRQSQSKEIQKIAKVYNIKSQKSRKAVSYHKMAPNAGQQRSPLNKTQSTTNYTPVKRRIKQTKSFVKVQSQIQSSPIAQITSRKVKPYFLQKAKKEELHSQHSPIMGIKFKQRSKLSVNITTQELLQPQSQLRLDQFRSEVRKNMKYWREKRDWDKIRGMNVDLIVNRNCKNFRDLISQYRRRMEIDQTSKIFIFDSKDLWMKRVLIDRGWIQNINKQSKAFHLIWSNKIYKEKLYSQQISNHYQNSYMITTKTGLHNLLRKYGITYLQPKTFDLATQKQQFIIQFQRTQFACFIKTFLQKFQFQEPSLNIKIQDILKQIKQFFVLIKKDNPNTKKQMALKLAQVIKYCEQILLNTFVSYDYILTREIKSSINSSYQLSEVEEEAIRIIRDFQILLQKQGIISHYTRIGGQNVWITKSKVSSKGVGITLYNNMQLILKHENRMAQKYIEKPLIIEKHPFLSRKFDLRVWVLLVGNKPEIYYHQRFYGRICYQSYSVQVGNLKNQNIHLTNYTQNKQLFTKKNELSQSIVLPQMLFNAVFQSFNLNYRDKFYQDIEKIIKKLATIFQNQIINRQTSNNFQLFGLDFLLDSALHLHLLEINLAAHCDERHHSLTEMLQNMGRGMLNILQNCQIYNFNRQLHGWVNIK